MKISVQSRVRLRVKGIVQGVGFRPFVYNLAKKHGLKGFCLNDGEGVVIEVEGGAIEVFMDELKQSAPTLSRIDEFYVEYLPPSGFDDFTIKGMMPSTGGMMPSKMESGRGGGSFLQVCTDIGTCKDCLRELFDPLDRRFKYPFINCTNCGPRYSIILDVPYDRARTTMAGFKMCPECESEYRNPAHRRFHAQPNACRECGPEVWLVKAASNVNSKGIKGTSAVECVKDLLMGGAIVAIRGLGGFHLACDATDDKAVKRLRDLKRGSNKPFAVMAPDVEAVSSFANPDERERRLIHDRAAPIVILEKKFPNALSVHVAPFNSSFGVMLPYTPLQHLIFHESGFSALVMTSGNISEEPIAVSNDEAMKKLSGIADFFLFHDRDIYMRVDDSIVRKTTSAFTILRRGRGYAPDVIDLGEETPVEILACGAELKNTFTLVKDKYAVLSQHIGNLTNSDAMDFFKETLKNLTNTFCVEPSVLAHDMHPDYLSTSFALEYGKEKGLRAVAVQHHHAHIVSVMAEKGIRDKVIGVSFDGTGYGIDGCVWGGEFLIASRSGFERAANFKYVPMPGGDKAAKEPWRMALSYLYSAFGDDYKKEAGFFFERLFSRTGVTDEAKAATVVNMARQGVNSPLTSSAGRLFDAVSSIAGIKDISTFEAEAAIALETAALSAEAGGVGGIMPDASYPFELSLAKGGGIIIDTAPVIRAICGDMRNGVGSAAVAWKFHNTIAGIILEIVKRIREDTGIEKVALSGGVFQNALLLNMVLERLKKEGLAVFHNEKVPLNDGGISLGQAVVALERIKNSS